MNPAASTTASDGTRLERGVSDGVRPNEASVQSETGSGTSDGGAHAS